MMEIQDVPHRWKGISDAYIEFSGHIRDVNHLILVEN